jgi:hypothetical protein
LKNVVEFCKNLRFWDFCVDGWDQCSMGSGSGGVAVGRVDRGDQGGSNGTSGNVAVKVLTEIRAIENNSKKMAKKWQ